MLRYFAAKEESSSHQLPWLQIFIGHIPPVQAHNRSVRHRTQACYKNACLVLHTDNTDSKRYVSMHKHLKNTLQPSNKLAMKIFCIPFLSSYLPDKICSDSSFLLICVLVYVGSGCTFVHSGKLSTECLLSRSKCMQTSISRPVMDLVFGCFVFCLPQIYNAQNNEYTWKNSQVGKDLYY